MLKEFKVPLFEQERNIRVYLPKNYNKVSLRYPVLYMHDGQNVFNNEGAIGGVSLELHKHLEVIKADIIVIAIDQNTENNHRIYEYCPWINGDFSKKLIGDTRPLGGKGKEYVSFIVNELKPMIDKKYRTDPTQTYMAGVSLGALISTYAASCYPNIFKRVAAISSAFYRNQEEIEKLLQNSDLTSLDRVYFDCGTKESGKKDEVSELFLHSNRRVYEIVTAKGVKAMFDIVVNGEHNYSTFKERVPNFIRFLTYE
ncbi:alpha/beta hydrolase [Oceanobacillus piezotolerans]|uniref:Alpha/beta hydrolase n=1 Tax=Oceanobacillus piezotolerans TaxID=2448030 RepID=A0A498DBK7_9BACI|nr:alpha/beta hydrolase-fold protein [Oceanobacillus piezotolerans]RLL48401.1 alpha/beta hydrolase [Oceanobacillus piezotolerans]